MPGHGAGVLCREEMPGTAPSRETPRAFPRTTVGPWGVRGVREEKKKESYQLKLKRIKEDY